MCCGGSRRTTRSHGLVCHRGIVYCIVNRDYQNRIPIDPFKDSFPSALSISLFDPFECGVASPAQNGRLTPFEPFERLGRRRRAGSRCGTSQCVSRLHSFTSCWNPGLRNENSLEIISGPIWPAVPRTAALQGDRFARNKR